MEPWKAAVARVKDADREAVRAGTAFVLGRFPEYFDGKVAEANQELETLYEQSAPGNDSESGSGHPAGD